MQKNLDIHVLGLGFVIFFTSIILISLVQADPEGPGTITNIENRTSSTTASVVLNESTGGGYIYVINMTFAQQNQRWKAYVGNLTGSLVLEDAGGNRIYDWELTTTFTGEVYATRNDTTIAWASIGCANTSITEAENVNMNHTSPSDNITATFNGTTHSAFTVASTVLGANTCPTTNPYVNSNAQDASFEEMVLWDGQSHNATSSGNGSVVFATVIETDVIGYDNASYDFQMILPENGDESFTSSTAYYFYLEVS